MRQFFCSQIWQRQGVFMKSCWTISKTTCYEHKQGLPALSGFPLGIGCVTQIPHAKAAAIPSGGGFTQNEAIRYAHFIFLFSAFA